MHLPFFLFFSSRQGMNFLAGALLLACSTRDPAVAKRPQGVARDRGGRTSGGGIQEYGEEGDVDAVVEVNLTMDSVPSWEESDDVDGSGEDERQARRGILLADGTTE